MRLSRLYLWVIAATVILGIILLVNVQFGMMFVRSTGIFLAICGLTLAYAIVSLGCAAAYENGKAPRLMRSGMIVGLIALACALIILLTPDLQRTMAPTKLFICLTVWPCLMMISGLLLLLPMHSGWRWWMRACTLIMLAALAVFIAAAYALYPDWQYSSITGRSWDDASWQYARRYEEGAFRIGATMTLLNTGLLAITLIVGIMSALTGASAPKQIIVRVPYWLQCPRCGREQEAMTGDHHCVACNLRTKVEFS